MNQINEAIENVNLIKDVLTNTKERFYVINKFLIAIISFFVYGLVVDFIRINLVRMPEIFYEVSSWIVKGQMLYFLGIILVGIYMRCRYLKRENFLTKYLFDLWIFVFGILNLSKLALNLSMLKINFFSTIQYPLDNIFYVSSYIECELQILAIVIAIFLTGLLTKSRTLRLYAGILYIFHFSMYFVKDIAINSGQHQVVIQPYFLITNLVIIITLIIIIVFNRRGAIQGGEN
ncbi:MAG: hypothetical protein R3Y54_05435 [Eubacteriales bacterium]